MGMNFPASPLVGDKYPTPAQAGIPQYTWDGTIWRAQTPPSTFVKLAGDTMTGDLTLPRNATSALHAVPKQQLDARVNDAMAYSGMQINGSMEVSQEKGSTATLVLPTSNYAVDGWYIGKQSPTGDVYTVQHTVVPSAAFRNSVQFYAGGTPPLTAPGNFVFLQQVIEGYRWSRLGFGSAAAIPVTIAFWANSSTGGVFSVALRNKAETRSYVTSVTLPVNAWSYQVITIPPETTGVWETGNLGAAQLSFCAQCSESNLFTPTPNAWATGNRIAVTGQANLLPATNQGVFITGVTVLPGIYAPTAAQSPLIMRPYDQELLTCRRYFQFNGASIGLWPVNDQTAFTTALNFGTPMRSSPTLAIAGTFTNGINLPGVAFRTPTAAVWDVSPLGNITSGVAKLTTAGIGVQTYDRLGELGAGNNGVGITLDARL